MDSKANTHNFWHSHTFIILMFTFMSLFSGIILLHSGFVNVVNDMPFHLNRIYDLRVSISSGNLVPSFSLNEFNQSGSAAMSMYPKLNLYPLTILSFIFKTPSSWMYIAFIIRNFISLVIGYFASYYYNKKRKISIIFTIAYTMTTMSLFQGVVSYDLGRSSSMIFLPLILFGALELLDNDKWIELTVGMISLISCHVLTPAIVIFFLLILFLININKFKDKDKLLSITKSIIITLLVSSFSWLPIISLMIKSDVTIPSIGSSTIEGVKPVSFAAPLINYINYSWTITALIGLVLGSLFYKKLSRYCKQFLYISVFFLFLCSNFFPWRILNNTFIGNTLQFPWRLFVIPELLLCYIFAILVVNISNKYSKEHVILFTISLLIVISELIGQIQIVRKNQPLKNDNIYSNTQVERFINKQSAGSTDYYPMNGQKDFNYIQNHVAIYNNNYKMKTHNLGNGKFVFKNNKYITNLSLPFLYYNGINYQVKLDGKNVKGYPNKNALMTINNIRKGKHHVQIIVHKTKDEIASYILSVIGLLILLGTILKNFIVKQKNK